MARTGDRADYPVLARLVREALGKRGEELSAKEVRALVRDFVRGGSEAVRLARAASPQEAARLVAQARERLSHARCRFADATTHRHPAIMVSPPWRAPRRALEEHRGWIGERDGVVGTGLSHRVKDGVPTGERCVVVLVEKKVPARRLKSAQALPAVVPGPGGAPVPVDVLEVGELRLKVGAGCSIGPSGTPGKGTLGTFGVDLFTRAPVALTAMHLLETLREYPGNPPSAATVFYSAPCDGQPQSQRLGRLVQGTRTGVDAAKIALDDPASASPVLPGIGPVAGWRPVDVEADRGAAVSMFGATSGQVQRGVIQLPLAFVNGLGLGASIVAAIPAVNGDSGAALVDSARLVLGLLVGGSDTVNVFSPIGDVLRALSSDIPSS